MSTLTKKWLQQTIAELEEERDAVPGVVNEDAAMALAAMKLALASLEAEPVAWLWSNRKHPSEVTLVRPEDDDKAEAAQWSGWSYKALYAEPQVRVAPEDLLYMAASAIEDLLSNIDRSGAGVWADIPAKLRRAAMLQGAENAESPTTMQAAPALDSSPKIAESPSGNSPVIPDGWVACSERMPESDDFVYIWPRPDFGVELHVAQYGKFDKRDAGWYAQVYEQNYGIEYYPIKVTHWTPLPAAPQQEVK